MSGVRRFGKTRRFLTGVGTVSVIGIVGCVALLQPRRESLNPWLLHYRVLLEGGGRLYRCVRVGVQVTNDYKRNVTDADEQSAWDIIHERCARLLVDLCETNGGMYVKLGQDFARLSHIIPTQYTQALGKLHDNVARRPASEVIGVIERDLGKPMSDIFESFDEVPVAAASLAQVHRGVLKGSHDEVAVKVQYIDIADRFDGDMATMTLMMYLCGKLFPGSDFTEIIQRLEGVVRDELNFVREVENAEKCRKQLEEKFGDRFCVPKVFGGPLLTRRVVMTEFIHGVKITDLAGLKGPKMGFSNRQIATISEDMIDAFSYQMFCTGFVHCDPHPGNLLVRRHPRRTGQPQLVILDHGLYVSFPDDLRHHFTNMWTACVLHDTDKVISLSRAIGVDEWEWLAAMFLEHPYDVYSPFKRMASQADLDLMRKAMREDMQKMSDILKILPAVYGMVLRNVTNVRAAQKLMGSPTSRTLRMLRWSLPLSDGAQAMSWWQLYCLSWKLWAQETVHRGMLAYAVWRNPELMKAVDDVLLMG